MTKTTSLCAVLSTVLVCLLPVVPAQAAGVARTFVSAAGSDSNNCANVATPCRHLAAAYAATAANGEIYVLDPANYGSLTITGPVSIEGHGWASIAPQGTNTAAITINANPGDKINIIGVVLDGTAITNTNGIVFNSGGGLIVRDSVIRDFTNNGINFVPTTQSTLSVSNTVVADNGVHGIAMKPNNSGSVVFTGTFTRVEAYNNGTSGIAVIGDLASTQTFQGVNAIAIDCVATGKNYASTSTGFLATSSQGIAVFKLFRSTAAGNFIGASAVSTNNAIVAIGLSQSNMELNRGPASASGTNAVVQSYSDNFTSGQTIASVGSTIPTE